MDGSEEWRPCCAGNTASGGRLQPAEFLAAAEEGAAASAIGSWVVREVTAQMARWMALDPQFRALTVHLNLSARQLAERRFLDAFRASTEASGVNPSSFVMEIAERVLADERPATARGAGRAGGARRRRGARRLRHRLRRAGLVATFPAPGAQDRPSRSSTASGIEPENTIIVGAVVDLAHALQLEAVAEGVETAGQMEILRGLGCDAVQGYVTGRPEPAADITDRLLELLVRGWSP